MQIYNHYLLTSKFFNKNLIKKIKKHTFVDEDYTDYIFTCEENGHISAYRKVNPFIMANRYILHFILNKDKKRYTLANGKLTKYDCSEFLQ